MNRSRLIGSGLLAPRAVAALLVVAGLAATGNGQAPFRPHGGQPSQRAIGSPPADAFLQGDSVDLDGIGSGSGFAASFESGEDAFVDPVDGATGAAVLPPRAPMDDIAGGTSSELERLLKRIDALETAEKKRAEADKKRSESETKKAEDEKQKKADEARKAEDWIDLSTEKWTVKLGGHVQLDYINWTDADPAIRGPLAFPGTKDYFEFRRLRLVADGVGYGVCDFRLQVTLEPETVGESPLGTVISPDVKDAYFTMNEIPFLGRFRIGNFFVPFSLEQVTNDTNNIFMERSIPTQGIFSPDREVGIAFYNCTEDQRVTWTTGMFLDSISEGLKERIDDNQGYRISGRLTALPYYDEPSKGRYLVHTGVGILHTNDQDNRYRIRARPQIHEGPRLIDTGVLPVNTYTTANVEGAVVMGPITVQSEAFLQQANRIDQSAVHFAGAYVHVSWFLTGENRIFEKFGQHGAQFGRNVPFTNFFCTPGGCGLGAWEIKARWSSLNCVDVDRGKYHDFTLGFNWYWSDRTRVMFDWIRPMTSQQATFGETESDLLAMRFDFNW